MSESLADYRYALPESLIARYPARERSGSRLLCLDAGTDGLEDHLFRDLPQLLRAGDLLVCNDTRVLPARLFGRKRDTGGRVEVLVERLLAPREMLAQLRASKPPKPGTVLLIEGPEGQEQALNVLTREGDFYRLAPESGELPALLERFGHMPLPPYIARADEALDRERYQTVYAERPGAVAAPTAGLHFDSMLLAKLAADGIELATVTLHVGAGTFQPVRCEHIADHRMHAEYIEVDEACCEAVRRARARGGRVIAVGTTSVRCLETAAADGEMRPFHGDTDIFIHPPYAFRAVDAMITNFHLSESTLLMLVCAFAGRERVLAAYRHAVEQEYRFFSYGDAMFISALRHADSLGQEPIDG